MSGIEVYKNPIIMAGVALITDTKTPLPTKVREQRRRLFTKIVRR